MDLLVTYDVNTTTSAGRKRLRQVARACEGFGQRVQYSVFEVRCSRTEYVRMLSQLVQIIDPSQDSLRVYSVERRSVDDVYCVGVERALSSDGPWNL